MEVNKITFYTIDAYQDTMEEPYPCYKHIPDWYTQTENIKSKKCPFGDIQGALNPNLKTNIKTCPAVFDYLTSGYIVPAWDNFLFTNINDSLAVSWERNVLHEKNKDLIFHTHTYAQQSSGLLKTNQTELYGGFHKLVSPWYIKTPPGISLYITNPSQYRDKRFTTVDAIVHTDEQPSALQWFFEWNTPLEENTPMSINHAKANIDKQMIKLGTPLILIIPFRRENTKYAIEYISEKNYHDNIKNVALRYTHDWFGNSLYNKFRKNIGRLFR